MRVASSSMERGATPPAHLASLYKLVDKQVIAAALCRHARVVELSTSAAVQAEALFGEDSLVVADLRMSECRFLLAVEASGAEREVHARRSWAALVSLIPLLLRRIEADTLLPGTVREEELDYTAHMQAAGMKAQNHPVASPPRLRVLASTMGYNTLLLAMFRSLDFLRRRDWPATQKRMVESLVLKGLDVIPRTAGISAELIIGEDRLVAVVKEMNPQL